MAALYGTIYYLIRWSRGMTKEIRDFGYKIHKTETRIDIWPDQIGKNEKDIHRIFHEIKNIRENVDDLRQKEFKARKKKKE